MNDEEEEEDDVDVEVSDDMDLEEAVLAVSGERRIEDVDVPGSCKVLCGMWMDSS